MGEGFGDFGETSGIWGFWPVESERIDMRIEGRSLRETSWNCLGRDFRKWIRRFLRVWSEIFEFGMRNEPFVWF